LFRREIEELEGASEQHLAVFGAKIPLVARAIKLTLSTSCLLFRREIEELEGASEQHLAVFGAKIPLVDRAIKRNLSRFKKSPIGPVGAFVKLKGRISVFLF
jgi:diadenosine tetraphosphate (Ap4A) HIT family hydrolase